MSHALVSCFSCRRSKRRCDKNLPTCQLCIHKGLKCSYPRRLKLVIEEFGVNINAKRKQTPSSDPWYFPAKCNGVLHDLALGKFWWHVNEALPYLIRMGADINIRNRDGETPLIAALKSRRVFSREAVEILIRAGADVNAADNENGTPLSIAGGDPEMTKLLLLLEHRAQVNPFVFLSALKREGLKCSNPLFRMVEIQ